MTKIKQISLILLDYLIHIYSLKIWFIIQNYFLKNELPKIIFRNDGRRVLCPSWRTYRLDERLARCNFLL